MEHQNYEKTSYVCTMIYQLKGIPANTKLCTPSPKTTGGHQYVKMSTTLLKDALSASELNHIELSTAPLHPNEAPSQPWETIMIDFIMPYPNH